MARIDLHTFRKIDKLGTNLSFILRLNASIYKYSLNAMIRSLDMSKKMCYLDNAHLIVFLNPTIRHVSQ